MKPKRGKKRPRRRRPRRRRQQQQQQQHGGYLKMISIAHSLANPETFQQQLKNKAINFVKKQAKRHAPALKTYAKQAIQRELPHIKTGLKNKLKKDVVPALAGKVAKGAFHLYKNLFF